MKILVNGIEIKAGQIATAAKLEKARKEKEIADYRAKIAAENPKFRFDYEPSGICPNCGKQRGRLVVAISGLARLAEVRACHKCLAKLRKQARGRDCTIQGHTFDYSELDFMADLSRDIESCPLPDWRGFFERNLAKYHDEKITFIERED